MGCPRSVGALLVFVALASGCGPSARSQSQRVEAWLELLADGQDGEALAQLADSRIDQGVITVEQFSRMVDRHPALRAHDAVEWRRVEPEGDRLPFLRRTWRLQGALRTGAVSTTLSCLLMGDGSVNSVRVGGAALLPPVVSVAPTPPPEPLVLEEPWVGVDGTELSVRGRTWLSAGDVTVRTSARCLHGEAWFRGTFDRPSTTAGGAQAIEGRVLLEAPSPSVCEVRVSVLQGNTRETTLRWMPSGSSPGSCPASPSPRPSPSPSPGPSASPSPGASPVPVSVREVSVDSTTVRYVLEAHRPLPPRYAADGASIRTRVSCPDGRSDRHTRPISSDELEAGVERRYGSVFSPRVWPDGIPTGCIVTLAYQVRGGERVPLWEGVR